MTHTHSYFFSPLFFFSLSSVNRSPKNPRANSGSEVRWWWDWGYGESKKVLPLMLTSVPGSARIWSTVSTWFLLQALWRRVSPSTRTHNGHTHPKERRGGREKREIQKLGCARCPAHCPPPYGEHTNKIPQKCPQTPKKKSAWPKKYDPPMRKRFKESDEKKGGDLSREKKKKNGRKKKKLKMDSWANSRRSSALL